MCCAVSQVSDVHALPSSQSASTLQHPATAGKAQVPSGSVQPSVVQASPSSQTTGAPAWHTPVAVSQVSRPSHATRSSQSASRVQHPETVELTHAPVSSFALASHRSVVHTMPSSQLGADPATVTQSPVVKSQCSTPSQNCPSSQVFGVPAHVPP